MRTLPVKLQGTVLLAPDVHGDERGFFLETFRQDALIELGIDHAFIQDNQSRSRKGIVRGMHFQPGQAKLVRCARGAILDVVVDVRVGSPQFGEWEGFTLDDVDHRQLYVPDGFAHGFCVLTDVADVTYKVSTYYDPHSESGFAFNDPAVGVQWPQPDELVASARDLQAPSLADIAESLPFRYTPA
jgi:dTDP-4-dehydrorhamnose 3,5-epimerase